MGPGSGGWRLLCCRVFWEAAVSDPGKKKKVHQEWKLEGGPRAWPTERTYGREREGGRGRRPEARELPRIVTRPLSVFNFQLSNFKTFFLFKSLYIQ